MLRELVRCAGSRPSEADLIPAMPAGVRYSDLHPDDAGAQAEQQHEPLQHSRMPLLAPRPKRPLGPPLGSLAPH